MCPIRLQYEPGLIARLLGAVLEAAHRSQFYGGKVTIRTVVSRVTAVNERLCTAGPLPL